MTGAMGSALTVGEASAARELGPAAELEPAVMAAHGVEVPIGGVGLWRNCGR